MQEAPLLQLSLEFVNCKVFANERQSATLAVVVEQFLNNKIGHVRTHLLGE